MEQKQKMATTQSVWVVDMAVFWLAGCIPSAHQAIPAMHNWPIRSWVEFGTLVSQLGIAFVLTKLGLQ